MDSVLIPSTAHARLVETASGRLLTAVHVHNTILTAGRRDAMMMLIGQRAPGVYKWVGIGTSTTPANANYSGIITAINGSNGIAYRTAGTWSVGASDFTLDVSIAGTEVEGGIREVALYPQQFGGVALYRYVLPATLSLTSTNTFVLSLGIVP